jgi:hypothetical protein
MSTNSDTKKVIMKGPMKLRIMSMSSFFINGAEILAANLHKTTAIPLLAATD